MKLLKNVEIETRSGVVISIPETELPVSVSGALADRVDIVDVIECARAIKAHCAAAKDCRTCAFGVDGGALCSVHSIPDEWEV